MALESLNVPHSLVPRCPNRCRHAPGGTHEARIWSGPGNTLCPGWCAASATAHPAMASAPNVQPRDPSLVQACPPAPAPEPPWTSIRTTACVNRQFTRLTASTNHGVHLTSARHLRPAALHPTPPHAQPASQPTPPHASPPHSPRHITPARLTAHATSGQPPYSPCHPSRF